MNSKDLFFGAVEVIAWIVFIYTILYSIKNPVNLLINSIIIVALAYFAAIACPIFRESKEFKTVIKRK